MEFYVYTSTRHAKRVSGTPGLRSEEKWNQGATTGPVNG